MKAAFLISLAVFVLAAVLLVQAEHSPNVESIKIPSSTLTHKYVVRLPHEADAEKIAARHGMRVVKQLKFHHRMGESKHGKGRYFLFERVEVASEDGSLAQFPHLHEAKEVHWYEQQVSRTRFKRSDPGVQNPSDPLFNNQWHLHNTPGVDVEIASVWSSYSGSGVTIAIVDDGLDWHSAEFSSNYRADCSYDVNYDDPDPTPFTYDVHGTAAAGVAAADVNQMCGVGVAPNARIAGIRVLADDVADFQEAEAVAYASDRVDIYSNSWGPFDDGKTLEGPGPLTAAAIESAIQNGRNGLGNIFVWACGNGNEQRDTCNYDGYANLRYTIAIGAIGRQGVQAYYSEPCSALMAVTPSSDRSSSITTCSVNNNCYTRFGGTSAASPLAAGLMALVLEVRPDLSWRDVQGVIVQAAQPVDSLDPDWTTNAAGHKHNVKYGFGRLTAPSLVSAAQNWENLPPVIDYTSAVINVNRAIPDRGQGEVVQTIDVEDMLTVEHVEVIFDARHSRRGDLAVTLIGPSGTASPLAFTHGDTNPDYSNWRFMSVRHWGESSVGTWTLKVSDGLSSRVGTFNHWQLIIHGSQQEFVADQMDIA